MKKIAVFTVICTVSLFGFTSCGSTAPCGLAEKSNQKQKNIINTQQQEVLVADISTEL